MEVTQRKNGEIDFRAPRHSPGRNTLKLLKACQRDKACEIHGGRVIVDATSQIYDYEQSAAAGNYGLNQGDIMSKTASIGKRPTTRPSPAVVAEVAEKAAPPKMKRLTIDIPDSLHRRVKSRCGHEGLRMADVIRDLLEQRFPKDLSF